MEGIEAPKRLEILIAHYDKTSELVQSARAQRDRLFLWLLMVLTIELFSAVHPAAIQSLALAVVTWLLRGDRSDVSSRLDFGVVNLFAYALWLYLLLNYYQRASYVRTYLRYLDRLEQLIGKLIGDGYLIREGAFYRAHYGRLQASVRFFYEWLFHALLFAVLLCRLWTERPQSGGALRLSMYGVQLLLTLVIGVYAAQYLLDFLAPRATAPLPEPESPPPAV